MVAVGLPKGSPCSAAAARSAFGVHLLSGRQRQVAFLYAWGRPGAGEQFWGQLCGANLLSPVPPAQRAIRVRSHSMETMVGSQKKHHGGGIPGSLSGGIAHNSGEVTKTTFSVSIATVPLPLCPSIPLSLPLPTPPQPDRCLHSTDAAWQSPAWAAGVGVRGRLEQAVSLDALNKLGLFCGRTKTSFLGLWPQNKSG